MAANQRAKTLKSDKQISALKSKNDEMERLIYTLSHDLKSPLVTINGFISILDRQLNAGELDLARSSMKRISGAANVMTQLVDELMTVSRESRPVEPMVSVNLGDVAQEALEMVSGSLAGTGIKVLLNKNLPLVYADQNRLRRVLGNLISNAIKFMGNQRWPVIEIGARKRDRNIVVYVKDNGIGIKSDQCRSVLEMFHKIDSGSEGSGLGLAIVKRIVEDHGGEVWVESKGDASGTCVNFTLPRKSDSGV